MSLNIRELAKLIILLISIWLFGFSLLVESPYIVFLSLSLFIWVSTLMFITSTKMIKTEIIPAQTSNLIIGLNKLLDKFGYENISYIIPPKLPGENPIQIIKNIKNNENDLTIIPIGLHFSKILEEEVDVDFFSIGLEALQTLLVKAIVDNYKLASGLTIHKDENTILINLQNYLFSDFYRQMDEILKKNNVRFVCPTITAIACCLAKATLKTVYIQKITLSNKNINIFFNNL